MGDDLVRLLDELQIRVRLPRVKDMALTREEMELLLGHIDSQRSRVARLERGLLDILDLADVDAAAEDATLIPFDTLFVTDNGRPVGRPKHRRDVRNDDYLSVCMVSPAHDWEFYAAERLRPMTED